jgi:oligopeptide/dipeptide ABC transporter ATP-binding protein
MHGPAVANVISAPHDAVELLEVEDLRVEFPTTRGTINAVSGVSFRLRRGETLGIVGESGSGKSMTALSLLRLVPPPGRIGGAIRFKGRDLLGVSQREMQSVRGAEIGMVFQDPMTSLNPVFRNGWQVGEPLRLHRDLTKNASIVEAVRQLQAVGIPDAHGRVSRYPHELSGGMRQRAMLAMTDSVAPEVLVADEPTTALDVTTQAQILELFREHSVTHGTSTILITHNFGVVAGMCDRLLVMYAGRVVEDGPTAAVFANPRHPYTWSLLRSLPRLDVDLRRPLVAIEGSPPDLAELPVGCKFHPRCPFRIDECTSVEPGLESVEDSHLARCWVTQRGVELGTPEPSPMRVTATDGDASTVASGAASVRPLVEVTGLKTYFPSGSTVLHRATSVLRAVDGVDLVIRRGETLGLVGESGCGKTTLGRSILRLVEPTAGQVVVNGEDLTQLSKREMRLRRRQIAMIFQDPSSSLDPRQTIGEIIGEALDIHRRAAGKQARLERIHELIGLVGLQETAINRYPHEFSGGERQRVGIARALAVEPDLVVCDEPVSALDVSIQAQIVNLLEQLQERLGLTYLFITHDLAIARHIADRVAVMYLGKIVEIAPADELYANPQHPYTASLISAIPIPDPSIERRRRRIPLIGEVPSALDPPSGCRFRTRCVKARPKCAESVPRLAEVQLGNHEAACFFPVGTP